MLKLSIQTRHKTYHFPIPEQWKECNKRQLLNGLVALRGQDNAYDTGNLLLLAMLDIRPWEVVKSWRILTLTAEDVNEALEAVIGFLAPNEAEQLIITEPLIPSFRHRGLKYFSPGNLLANSLAGEFMAAEYHYRMFMDNPKDITPLWNLLAILYRPGKQDPALEDWREPFNNALANHRAKKLSTLHKGYAYYALELYRGAQIELRNHFPQLFTETDEESTAEEIRNSWGELIIEVAGGKFGTVREVERTPVGDIFMHLRQLKEQFDKQKQQR